MLHHRGPDFKEHLPRDARRASTQVYRTANDVLVITASGTGAFESAIVNLCSPGDRILVVSCGEFGERWQKLGAAFGLDVVPLRYAWGATPDPAEIGAKLAECGADDLRRRALRDLDGRRLRSRGDPRRLPADRRDLDRRRDLEPRRRAARDRRVGRRRRRHRLAEGADDAARPRVRLRLRPGLGAVHDRHAAALLLRLGEAAQGAGEGLDRDHARDLDRRRAPRGARRAARRRRRGHLRPSPGARPRLPRRA